MHKFKCISYLGDLNCKARLSVGPGRHEGKVGRCLGHHWSGRQNVINEKKIGKMWICTVGMAWEGGNSGQ